MPTQQLRSRLPNELTVLRATTTARLMSASEVDARRLVRDVLLRDGSTLRLTATTREDFDDIKAFYDQLSEDNRFFRFHGYGRTDPSPAPRRRRLASIGLP